MGNAMLHLIEFSEQVHAEDLLSEIPVVQLAAHHDFIKVLQLSDGEFSRQQLEPYRRVAEFSPQPLEGHLDYSRVIERKTGEALDCKPCCLSGIGPGDDSVAFRGDERIVSHRYYPASRIASRIAKRIELFEEYVVYPGLLLQFPGCRLLERLASPDESARYCPHAGKRLQVTFDEHHLKILCLKVQPEDHAINSHGRHFVLVLVRHLSSPHIPTHFRLDSPKSSRA